MNLLPKPMRSSLGKKYVMAVTGLALTLFVIGHMIGNLLIFAGRDAINSYAAALKHNFELLWTARIGLLVVFVVHLLMAFLLSRENRIARPRGYYYESTLQANWASRHMLLTGLVLFAFIVFHLAHYTLGLVHKASFQLSKTGNVYGYKEDLRNYLDLAEIRDAGKGHYDAGLDKALSSKEVKELDARHDVYSMVINGFRNPVLSGIYLVAMVFLALHLWHGASSFLQTLGLNATRYQKIVWCVGPTIASIVFIGNCSIVLAVLCRIIP